MELFLRREDTPSKLSTYNSSLPYSSQKTQTLPPPATPAAPYYSLAPGFAYGQTTLNLPYAKPQYSGYYGQDPFSYSQYHTSLPLQQLPAPLNLPLNTQAQPPAALLAQLQPLLALLQSLQSLFQGLQFRAPLQAQPLSTAPPVLPSAPPVAADVFSGQQLGFQDDQFVHFKDLAIFRGKLPSSKYSGKMFIHANHFKPLKDVKAKEPAGGSLVSDSTKPYVCSSNGCTWSFARQSDLRRHSKSHREPMFHCPYWQTDPTCHRNGGSFTRLDVLKRHLKLVHYVKDKQQMFAGADPGWCRACQKMFQSSKHFIDHCVDCANQISPAEWRTAKKGEEAAEKDKHEEAA